MSIEDFRADPWRRSHEVYEASAFNVRPAPEFATAEVVVASLYRWVGFEERPEAQVPAAGKAFNKLCDRAKPPADIKPLVSGDTWRTVVRGVLESPKQPNQSSKRFLQLTPVVPDAALYSGSARLTGNSWNPGLMVQRMILLGSASSQVAEGLWTALFDRLSVESTDDVWARWLQSEFMHWGVGGPKWTRRPLVNTGMLSVEDHEGARFPAQQFVRDLESILAAKGAMTRRQWVSVVEALLRLGTVAHTLWLCDVNDQLWREARRMLDGEAPPDAETIRASVLSSHRPYLIHGNPAVSSIREYASRYLVARLGLNLLLHRLSEQGTEQRSLSSAKDIAEFLASVSRNRGALAQVDVLGELGAIRDSNARTMNCKKGIGSNLVEFCRYVLGQRQTANDVLRGYDQGYLLRKQGEHRNAQWIVSLGPVALLALVHCCLRDSSGPRSINRFCHHLRTYGLDVDRDDIASSDLGRKLRMLGLVLDSPDAEGGMLLLPPFDHRVGSLETGA